MIDVRRATLCTSLALLLLVAPAALASQASPSAKFLPAGAGAVPDEYLVLLEHGIARPPGAGVAAGPAVDELAQRLVDAYGGEVMQVWEHALQGFAIQLDEASARLLAEHPWVELVQQNRTVAVPLVPPGSCYGWDLEQGEPARSEGGTLVSQPIVCDDPDPRNPNRDCNDNWGLDRIDQISGIRDGVYDYSSVAHGVHVYVLDTGILASHNEFFAFGPPFTRVVGGTNAVIGGDPANTTDCYGHGTHVAGIIGGSSTGVAKGVWLHPVKFLDGCSILHPGGRAGDIINGLNWIVANHDPFDGPAVVNYSGGNGDAQNSPKSADPMVQQVVANVLAAGISFVQSAGNQNDDINGTPTNACERSLGGVPGLEAVIVAGGIDTNLGASPPDGRWIREIDDPSFDEACLTEGRDCGSNSGSCVDVWAPAAHVVSASAFDTGGRCRLSGTSMAAPHVTGAVALYLQSNPSAPPAQVQQAIADGATCGALDANPASPYYIGDGSPNLLVNTLFNGGGPGGCNQPPVANDDHLSTPQNTLLTIGYNTLRANDFDPDGDDLFVWSYDPVTAHGGSNDCCHAGGFNYQPPPGFTGTDWFQYNLTDRPDGSGLFDTATVFVEVTATESVIGEVGQVGVNHVPKTVVLSRSYVDPVVIAQPPSFNGGHAAVVRITSVASDRFVLYVHEPPNLDGPHAGETVGYVVIEAGSWQLADGTEVRAGKLQTAATVGGRIANSWATVGFGGSFTAPPAVLSQVQSNADPSWVKTRQRAVGASSFQVALEKEEASLAAHGTETVGWIAVTPASGDWSGHPYVAARTPGQVTHDWYSQPFPLTLGPTPIVVAALTTYNGADSCALRYRNLGSTSVELKVEEETTWDMEIGHVGEAAAHLAFGDPGVLLAAPN